MIWISLGFFATLAVSYAIYFGFNHGMSRSARGQQTRRMAVASLVAWLPMAAGCTLMPLLIGGLWMVTYPLLYHLTNRRVSPDYENYADITFGIYLIGLLTAATLLATTSTAGLIIIGILEFLLLMPVVFMWGYYFIYGTCVDTRGLLLIQETDFNEAIEFLRSFRWYSVVAAIISVASVLALCIAGNLTFSVYYPNLLSLAGLPFPAYVITIALAAYTLGISWYLFKPTHSLSGRTGLFTLVHDIREYIANNRRYLSEKQKRTERLQVTPLGEPYEKPHTVLLVIGESASRDYMSAFTCYPHDTTPWMRKMAEDTKHTILFKNAYSCTMHTVQVLEKALTEMNQYSDKPFNESCSVVDVAHALGYSVHWYSNQGHLGVFDTPVTIVAGTSNVAKWTEQSPGTLRYDKALLRFFDEVDATQNNLIILHLIGSHFNFLNRYPNDTHTFWGKAGVQDDVLNYENSLRYTDEVLQETYEYCRKRLNLKAMVYCSDHATMPDRRRTPNFNGFRNMRIPLFVWTDDEYLLKHPERVEALRQNSGRYFTNDLLYELMLGLFDVKSNCYDETASLASTSYKYQREDLLTFDGKQRIADDDEKFTPPQY